MNNINFPTDFTTNLLMLFRWLHFWLLHLLAAALVALSDELNLSAWQARSPARRLAENFCSLFTPIL